MAFEFKLVRRVEFSETDMAGIVHYSNFFRYAEAAESAFFRSLGLSIRPPQAAQEVGWPRVHAECDYAQPLRFEDEIEIHLLVAEKSARKFVYQFRIRKLNAQPPVEVARGKIIAVCVKQDGPHHMKVAQIPADIAEKIEVAPKELL
ncbi:MAG: acyl-CoA thioesterase [Verrucomicrobia bacterium]|nr:MAG: acyl-CoA thioesterase [Verrucomicrobiota bacterium]